MSMMLIRFEPSTASQPSELLAMSRSPSAIRPTPPNRTHSSLSAVLDKAAAHAEAKKIDPAMLLNARSIPTCFPWRARCERRRTMPRAGAAPGFDRGKQKLGPISKQGDRYLRRILIVGAIAVLRRPGESCEVSPAHATSRTATLQGRGGGARQQDGAHGLADFSCRTAHSTV
jgi:hypothetical protein